MDFCGGSLVVVYHCPYCFVCLQLSTLISVVKFQTTNIEVVSTYVLKMRKFFHHCNCCFLCAVSCLVFVTEADNNV